jgi:hypothetical protein
MRAIAHSWVTLLFAWIIHAFNNYASIIKCVAFIDGLISFAVIIMQPKDDVLHFNVLHF